MPWTGQSFAQRHNHQLSPEEAGHASRIANAILRGGAPERIAIATANKLSEHHKRMSGGGILHRDIGGVMPSSQNQNPMTQGMIQRYASMSPEQLAQLASMMGNTPQGQVIQKLLQQKRVMGAQQQQQAPAQQAPGAPGAPVAAARGGILHRDIGGMAPSMETPWWTKAEARGETSGGSGFLAGSTPGRADALKTTAPAGSYVLPADVVAGLGQGNSLAGARATQEMLSTGPHGMPLPRGGGRSTMPRPPPEYREGQGEANGGYVASSGLKLYRAGGVSGPGGDTPVLLSHGEYVVAPEDVQRFGTGDHKKGIEWFDKFVVEQRRKQIEKLKKLPGPVKTT